jgi:hypothetical protein
VTPHPKALLFVLLLVSPKYLRKTLDPRPPSPPLLSHWQNAELCEAAYLVLWIAFSQAFSDMTMSQDRERQLQALKSSIQRRTACHSGRQIPVKSLRELLVITCNVIFFFSDEMGGRVTLLASSGRAC